MQTQRIPDTETTVTRRRFFVWVGWGSFAAFWVSVTLGRRDGVQLQEDERFRPETSHAIAEMITALLSYPTRQVCYAGTTIHKLEKSLPGQGLTLLSGVGTPLGPATGICQ